MAAVGRKLTTRDMIKALVGAIIGAVATGLFLFLLDDRIDTDDAGSMIAIVAGLSYFLMGLLVGFGALAPNTGARFLNVEDADEIREERPKLAPSAIACVLIGVFLLTLVLAESFGDPSIGLAITGAALVAVVMIAVRTRRQGDELMRQVGFESAALTLHSGLLVMAIWAALAHLGFAGWVDPLAFIAGVALLYLIAIFEVAGTKGLMRSR